MIFIGNTLSKDHKLNTEKCRYQFKELKIVFETKLFAASFLVKISLLELFFLITLKNDINKPVTSLTSFCSHKQHIKNKSHTQQKFYIKCLG